ncbi:hypothetical protein Q9V03_000734 [Salmonella enterica]|nr:hypothetical protein [Salmonella enterica]ECO7733835.1 hypothetical protein [Salmonella enterica]EDZ7377390.1 hypothetical protein [Salmonella enterica]EEK5737679.1 hypothetical protein [Salmonella enterica]EEL9952920.1 hypothetical protein [Salmonella enterica]
MTNKYRRYSLSPYGFRYDEVIRIMKDFYMTCGYVGDRDQFFKDRFTSHATMMRNCRWFGIDIQRYYRVDGGKIYKMNWVETNVMMKKTRWIDSKVGKRNSAFKRGYRDERALFVELMNCYYSTCYRDRERFEWYLQTVDISRPYYKKKIKQYQIKVEFFMSLDGCEPFPYKCRAPKY